MSAPFGHIVTEATREKIRQTLTGRKHTMETRQKMSVVRKANPIKHWLGKTLSIQHKKQISKSLRGSNNPNWGKHLSEEQKQAISNRHRGSNHQNWKGGTSITYRKHLTERAWNILAQKIRKRDNLTCQICGEYPAYCVHHIIPWRINKDDGDDNLITFCRSCHMKTERAIQIV